MQINGIGSNSTSGMYQNTNRKPNYEIPEEAKEDSVAKQQAEASQDAGYVQFIRSTPVEKQAEPELQPEEGLTLNEWLKVVLEKAKSFLTKIWTGEAPADAAALSGTVTPRAADDSADNTMESTVEIAAKQQENLWQKIKVSFENIAGYLLGLVSFGDKSTQQHRSEQTDGSEQPPGQGLAWESQSGQDLARKQASAREQGNPPYFGEHQEMGRMLRDKKYFATTYNKKGQYTTFAAPTTKDTHVIDEDL